MGNCMRGCYEYIHSIGPYAKVIRCKYCGKNEWRGHYTVDYVREKGCIICRYKNKMNTKASKMFLSKCRGRYDDLEEVDLNDSPMNKKIKSPFLGLYDKYNYNKVVTPS